MKMPIKYRPVRRVGFTLIELIAVVGIMGLVILLAVPTFTSALGKTGAREATYEIVNALRFARENAIANQTESYLIFADHPASGTASENEMYHDKISRRLYMRAYTVWSERDNYTMEWKYLPKGVVFLDRDAGGSKVSALSGGTDVNGNDYDNISTIHEIRWKGTDSDPKIKVRGIGFKPDGTLIGVGGGTHIYVVEGFTNGEQPSGSLQTTYTEMKRGWDLLIYGLTGNTKITDFDDT